MIIVTTPMCKKIVEFAGITEFKVNKYPDNEVGDLAILLSENKTKMPSLNIKLNTFSQIKESIIELANIKSNLEDNIELANIKSNLEDNIELANIESNLEDNIELANIESIFNNYDFVAFWRENKDKIRLFNSTKNVKVYSNFLKDIVKDIGCNIVDDSLDGLNGHSYDYVIFPDYLNDKISESANDFKFIEIPSHSNISLDPIVRAETRYKILIDNL